MTLFKFHSLGPSGHHPAIRKLLWEWLENGSHSKIYRFDEFKSGGGFVIGGLKPTQAKQLVEFHNHAIAKAAEDWE